MAIVPRLVGRRQKESDVDSGAIARTDGGGQSLSKAQQSYLAGLRRLRMMGLDPDLERQAAADLGQSYRRQFGDEEMARLQRMVYDEEAARHVLPHTEPPVLPYTEPPEAPTADPADGVTASQADADAGE
jgi:hypothetical protein